MHALVLRGLGNTTATSVGPSRDVHGLDERATRASCDGPDRGFDLEGG